MVPRINKLLLPSLAPAGFLHSPVANTLVVSCFRRNDKGRGRNDIDGSKIYHGLLYTVTHSGAVAPAFIFNVWFAVPLARRTRVVPFQ